MSVSAGSWGRRIVSWLLLALLAPGGAVMLCSQAGASLEPPQQDEFAVWGGGPDEPPDHILPPVESARAARSGIELAGAVDRPNGDSRSRFPDVLRAGAAPQQVPLSNRPWCWLAMLSWLR